MLELPAGKPRALLAVLLLHPGEVVSVDKLVDELWGEHPPPTAAKNVQGYVARLRRTLGDDALVTKAPGYALRVDGRVLDAARFQELLEEARHEDPASGRRAAPEAPFPSGVGLRSRTSPTSRSRRTKSDGSRTCDSQRWRTGSRPTWLSVATTT